MRQALAMAEVYQVLEPGPVVLLTTSRGGRANVMTMSWHMMVEFEPPLVGCVVSSGDFSFAALRATGECVLAVPDETLLETVAGVGNCSGREVDKFARFALTAVPATRVAAPLVDECFVNLECVVSETRLVKRLNLFVLEVVRAWAEPDWRTHKTVHHRGWGEFVVDGAVRRVESKMR